MSVTEILDNTAETVAALGYREADNRLPVEKLPQGGTHGRFQVSESPAGEVLARHALSDNVRETQVLVRVAYARGGGATGNRYEDNIRAMNAALAMAGALEGHDTYDAQDTGIRRRRFQEVRRSADLPRATAWDLAMLVEWEENEAAEAVA